MFPFHVQEEAVSALYGALKAKSLNSCPGEITAGMPATTNSGRHSGGFFSFSRDMTHRASQQSQPLSNVRAEAVNVQQDIWYFH